MHFQDCFTGQRVVHKESGKLATIRKVHGTGEVELTFDGGATGHVHARILEPVGETAPATTATTKPGDPMRPCPNCATKMLASLTKCPSCGFEYGVKKGGGGSGFVKFVVILIVLAAIGYAVWKFVLHEKLPW